MKRVKKITKGTLKYFILPLAILIITLSAAGLAVLYFYPKDKLLSMITTESEKILSRKVVIRDIHYGFGGVSLSNFSVLSSINPDDAALVSAESIKLRVSIPSLFKNKIKIKSILISNLKINIYYDKKWNLDSLITDIINNTKDSKSDTETTINYLHFENALISLKSTPEFMKHLVGDYVYSGRVYLPKDYVAIRDFSIKMPESRGLVEGHELIISPLDKTFSIKGSCQLNDCSMA